MARKRSPEAKRRKRQHQYQRLQPQIEALYDEVCRRFPQTFFRAPQDVQPLQIGIFHELCDRIDAPRQVLRRVMGRYTSQRAYLQALAAGKPRLDLSGQAVEPVSESQRAQAQARLNRQRNWRRASHRSQATHTPHAAATSGATAPQAPAAATLSGRQVQEGFTPPPAVSAAGTPPMTWSKSITSETIICLECGQPFKQLSLRHLSMHGLDSGSYRAKYGIPRTQPLVTRATTERRRQVVQETRPWEKAPTYRKGQARNGHRTPEPEAETVPDEAEAPTTEAASAPPKRQRKTSPMKTARQTRSEG